MAAKFNNRFVLKKFNNKADKQDYIEMAYNTFCVNVVKNLILKGLKFEQFEKEITNKDTKKTENTINFSLEIPKLIISKAEKKHGDNFKKNERDIPKPMNGGGFIV